MKKRLGYKLVANLALVVMLVGGLVYAIGFGLSLYIARQEVMKQTDEKVELSLKYVQQYVDEELESVEDVAYTFLSSKFGGTVRLHNGDGLVTIDPNNLKIPGEEEVFQMLESLLNANPQICGVAIGFEPSLYQNTKGKYGFAAYVTNVSGKNERLKLGEIHDFHQKEWYAKAAHLDAPYWSLPFRETSQHKVVTCFSLPLHGYGNRLIGVMAIDIDTDAFRKKCVEVTPFPHAEVSIVDREFRFVAHPDTTFLLRKVSELDYYADYDAEDDSMFANMNNQQSGQTTVRPGSDKEALFYYAPIPRTKWTLGIECPKTDVFHGVDRMKRDTTWIAIISILVMIICFIWLFRHLQSVVASKAGMESELNVASRIQMGMLPKLYPAFPDRPELDVYGFLKPAKSVGGDLYDYFIRDNKFFFCIGDVSGKGVPASLFMAVIRALFRNISLHSDDPADILSMLNTAIAQGNDQNMFCTIFLGILDLKTGKLEYCNGGHNTPIVRRVKSDGSVDVHFANIDVNIAVGIIEDFPYVKQETTLAKGDAIFLYTDGVTEAESIDKKLFGEEATMQALADARNNNVRSAKDFVEYVYGVVERHAQGAEQSDDITMLVVEYH